MDDIRQELTALRALVEQQQKEIASLKVSAKRPANVAPDDSGATTRRRLLLGAAVAAAGAVAMSSARPAAADNGQPLTLGAVSNTATLPTGLAFLGDGVSSYGLGVTDHGLNEFPAGAAIAGHAKGGVGFFTSGVLGYENSDFQSLSGVLGVSENGTGVEGRGGWAGVLGVHREKEGFGVHGQAYGDSITSIAVFAQAVGENRATALAVDGVLRARRAGRVKVQAGSRTATVRLGPLTETSLVLATAQRVVGNSAAVQGVTVNTTTAPRSFTIRLTGPAPAGGLPVAWVVIDTIGKALS